LKLALDATYSVGRDLSGVGVYSREILVGVARAHPEAKVLACYRPHRLWLGMLAHLPANCRRTLLQEAWMAPLWGPRTADLFHGLNQRLPAVRFRRAVSTFHDLFVLTGDYSTPEFRARFARQARDAAERSDLIVTVSAFTASQVERLLGVERSRLRVIHHGVQVRVTGQGRREKIILHVGAIQRRKNVARLVEAFERLPPGWRLVLAGSAGYGAEQILARVQASPRRADIETPGYVSPAALADLYARASVFAFPSLDEGFGMPVLDAMASGVPVVTSNRSALPEVAGDAALLVDPSDTDSIAGALSRLAEDGSLRRELRERGFERAARFTWQAAVEKTWAVYQELLG
jgi:glycosyltransferase involved in cell wall biosynthesis